MWRSMRCTRTGCPGVAASIHSRTGSAPPQSSWSHPPPVIHAPSGMRAAHDSRRRASSSGEAASRRDTRERLWPPAMKWAWASTKPGRTVRPSSDSTRVPAPASEATPSSPPTASTRPSFTATAVIGSRTGRPVQTEPSRRMRSATEGSPPEWGARIGLRHAGTAPNGNRLGGAPEGWRAPAAPGILPSRGRGRARSGDSTLRGLP